MKISPYTICELYETHIDPLIDAVREFDEITRDATKDNPVTVGNYNYFAPFGKDDRTIMALMMAAIQQDIADLRREVKELAKSAKAKGGAK